MLEFFFRMFFEWLPFIVLKFWWLIIIIGVIIGIKFRRWKTVQHWRFYWEEEKKWKAEQEEIENKPKK